MEIDLKLASIIIGSVTAMVVGIFSLYKNGKLSKEIEKIKAANLGSEAEEKIFCKNIAKLLKLDI